MKIHNAQYKIDDSSILNYYEVGTEKNKLLLLHAQGTNSCSFDNVVTKLAKHYHVYLVDYYGHGKSSHNPEKYNLVSIGNDIIDFIENVICDSVAVLGHSSGGLIAAYIEQLFEFAKPHGRLDAQLIEDLELPLTLQHLHHRHNRAIATLRKNDVAYLFFGTI